MNYRTSQKRSNPGYYTSCPRCGWHSFEHLSTHRHCINCLYYQPNFEDMSMTEAMDAEKLLKQLELKQLKKKALAKNSDIQKQKQKRNGDLEL